MVVAEVCVCVLQRKREMRVCLYWHSKVTAPSSAILSRTVNHWTDDLDAPVLWGAKHAHEWRHTLTYTLHPDDHMFDSVKNFFIFSVKCYQKKTRTQKGTINISKLILWLWKQSWSLTYVYISLQWITVGHLWAEICSRCHQAFAHRGHVIVGVSLYYCCSPMRWLLLWFGAI